MKLSVLDQSPIRPGATPADAIADTLALAQAADRLGYHRYWLAEHHNSGWLASSSPEILIGEIASRTKGLRVGSGGVMLSHYSSLKVAETFRMLETLYPGRIDLGIGRAPGSDQLTAMALAHGPGHLGIEHYPAQIRDLLGYLHGELPADHPFARVRAVPEGPGAPEFWLLGTSGDSASFAAYFGCAFSFGHFISDVGGPEIMAGYRQHFRPGVLAAPEGSVGIFALAAEDEEMARRLAKTREIWFLRRRQGVLGPAPTLAEADAYQFSEVEERLVAEARRRIVCGTPEAVHARLCGIAESYGVDELVIVTICPDFESRLRSYELIAESFGLAPRSG